MGTPATVEWTPADRLSWPSMHWDWRTPAAHKAIADAVRRHILGEEQNCG